MVIYFKMNFLENQRILGALIAILAIVALPIFLLYPYSLDDLQAFSAIHSRSYLELAFGSHGWEGTVFYRPLIDLQTKLIWDLFEGNFFAYKLYQFFLFIVFLLILNNLVVQLRLNLLGTALLVAMLMSSRAIHDAFLWWVNMGQAIVLVCFALLLNFFVVRQSYGSAYIAEFSLVRAFIYGGLSFLALFSKEVGLVVLIGFAYLAYLERNRIAEVVLFLIFVAFVLARIYVIGGIEGGGAFMASSGLGTSYLSGDELRDAFSNSNYLFYTYNIFAQFFYALLKHPVDGQFMSYDFAPRNLATIAYTVASGYLIVILSASKVRLNRGILVMLLGAIVINSILSFPYSRARIMIAADLAGAVLFALIASSLHVTSSDAVKHIGSLKSQGLGLVAVIFVLLISLTRAIRRYFLDISSSLESMRQFVSKDYQLVIEAQGPLPPTVIDSIVESVDAHYSLILRIIGALT